MIKMTSAIPNDASTMFSLDATFPMGSSSHNPQAPVVMSAAPISICKRCQHPGVDVKCLDCGCMFHAVRLLWSANLVHFANSPGEISKDTVGFAIMSSHRIFSLWHLLALFTNFSGVLLWPKTKT